MKPRGAPAKAPTGARPPVSREVIGQWIAAAAGAYAAGEFAGAERLCRQILAADPAQYDALEMLGILVAQSARLPEAARLLQRGILARPDSAEAHFNYANILQMLGRIAPALQGYDQAIELQPSLGEAHSNRGHLLLGLGRTAEALEAFQRAVAAAPTLAEAWHGAAVILREGRHLESALRHCDRALMLKPQYAQAHNTRGLVLQDLEQLQESVAAFQAALAIRPDYADAYRNLGATWQAQAQHVQAIDCFEKALRLDPDYPWLPGTLAFARLQLCDWRDFGPTTARLAAGINAGRPVVQPFAALVLTDSPRLQRRAAETWARDARAEPCAAGVPATVNPSGRIRLGYFSADFHDHATTYLAAEVFERHDRERFELVAFSFGPAAGDRMRQRVSAAFDEFLDVRDQSDAQIARLSRTRGIDIAVDMKGYTNFARSGIFASRAAPLQVSFLGYPGTMGSRFIDYLVADRRLIDPGSRPHFAESIAYLPHSYQPNDSKRLISAANHSRAELGLPDQAFVFCCFNNPFKITPDVFDVWMRLLRRIPHSVLWLLADNPEAARNLRREAHVRGVTEDRLVFAPRWPLSDHLARLRAADLCLDTLPYNSHTTASDALWSGVPILTRAGESFAGRVTASLLTAVGLPELITTTAPQFESLAIDLALQPERLAALRNRLADNRIVAPLFDAGRFTRDLESAYARMHARRLARLPPQDFDVGLEQP